MWDWLIPLIGTAVSATGSYFANKNNDENADADRDLQARALGQTAEVNRANFTRQNPGIQMGNAVRGDTLAGLQSAKFTGSGRDLQLTGGLNPGLLSQGTRDLGSYTSRQAMLAGMNKTMDPGMSNPYTPPNFGNTSQTNPNVAPTPSNQIYMPTPDHPAPTPAPTPAPGIIFQPPRPSPMPPEAQPAPPPETPPQPVPRPPSVPLPPSFMGQSLTPEQWRQMAQLKRRRF